MEQLVHLRNKNAKRFYVGFRTRDLTVRFRLGESIRAQLLVSSAMRLIANMSERCRIIAA